MASKAVRKKELVKQLKQQQASTQKKPLNKGYLKTILLVVIVAAIVYFIISSASAPRYVPEATGPSWGPADAEVTFLEFGCFTCPFTKQFNLDVVPKLQQEFEGKVRFVFRSMPIPTHAGSSISAEAGKCANDQNLFWDYSEILFRSGASFTATELKSDAAVVGMNMDEFNQCLDSGKYKEQVKTDYNEGKKAGITVTPTVFIDGVMINGIQDIDIYRRVINDKLAGK